MLQQLGASSICQTQRSVQSDKASDNGAEQSQNDAKPQKQKHVPSRITNFSTLVHRDNTKFNFFGSVQAKERHHARSRTIRQEKNS